MKNKRSRGRRRSPGLDYLDTEAGPDIWQRLTRVLLGVMLLGVIAFVVAQFMPEVDRQKTVDAELAELTARRDALRRESGLGKARLDRLRTDPEYMERYVRSKLDVYRPGETVIRFAPHNAEPVPRAVELTEP